MIRRKDIDAMSNDEGIRALVAKANTQDSAGRDSAATRAELAEEIRRVIGDNEISNAIDPRTTG